MSVKNGVFISYSRKDGQEFAAQIREKLEEKHIDVWQDVIRMEGGQDWWFQITDALDNVEFMVLVATPGAIDSPIVRKEWRYARQQGVCVYPVLVPGNHPDFTRMPRWMRDIHFYDYGKPEQQAKFYEDLAGRCEFVKVPFMAGPLPDDYVERKERMEQLLSLLLSDSRDEPVAITAALRGAGGYGKTVIAKALCHHDAVQAAYDDGILWVTLGENPGKPTEKLLNLVEVLTNERPSFTDVDSARTRFQEVVGERDLLFVIDDVWRSEDAEPFLNAGPRCTYLITTRDDSTLPRRSKRVRVDSMTPEESAQLLLVNLQNEPDVEITQEEVEDLKRLAKALGNWALLLKLARGSMEEEILEYDRTVEQAVTSVRRDLENYGLQAFDPDDAESRRLAVKSTLGASLSRLEEAEFTRFTELGIFPEDVAVSLRAVGRMWGATGKYDEGDTERLCKRLNRLSLLLDLELPNRENPVGYLRLHDVVRTHLRNEALTVLPDMAEKFLNAYHIARWADLDESEEYLWDHLAYHLIEARRYDELIETVNDLEYLATKIFLRGSNAAELDIQLAVQQVDDRRDIRVLSQTIAKSSDVLAKCLTPSETLTNIVARLGDEYVVNRQKNVMIRATHQLPDLPHYALNRTMRHDDNWVNDCDIHPEKMTVLATHNDETIRLWDMTTGSVLAEGSFTLSSETLWRCQFTPSGNQFVISTVDGHLQLWSARDMRMIWSRSVYESGIPDVVISPSGQYVVASSKSDTVYILDVSTGETQASLVLPEEKTFTVGFGNLGHVLYIMSAKGEVYVWSTSTWEMIHQFALENYAQNNWYIWNMRVSPDEKHFLLGCSNGLVQMWNIQAEALVWESGEQSHKEAIRQCHFSPDGKLVSTASADHIIKIWRAETGEVIHTLQGHRDKVNNAVFSADSGLIASASKDGTVRIWDLNAEVRSIRTTDDDHESYVTACEFSADGKLLVTASEDQTMRVWNVEQGTMVARMEEHKSLLPDCTISPTGFTVVSIASNPRLTDNILRSFDALTGQHLDTLAPTKLGAAAPSLPSLPPGDESEDPSAMFQRLSRLLEEMRKRAAFGKTTSAWLQSCQYSPDGSLIAVGTADLMGNDNTVKLIQWPSKELQHELAGHTAPIYDCAFSPDGRLLASVSSDGTVRVWEVETGETRYVLEGHLGPVFGCQFSHDGKWLLSASADWTLRRWDVATGQEVMVYEGHENPVWGCALNHDASLLVSVSEDNTLKVWDVPTGNNLTTLYTEGFLLGCDWDVSSGRIAAVGERGIYFLEIITPD